MYVSWGRPFKNDVSHLNDVMMLIALVSNLKFFFFSLFDFA